jgi:hypothetical protein
VEKVGISHHPGILGAGEHKWRMENGKRRMENSEQWTVDSERRVENGEWRAESLYHYGVFVLSGFSNDVSVRLA